MEITSFFLGGGGGEWWRAGGLTLVLVSEKASYSSLIMKLDFISNCPQSPSFHERDYSTVKPVYNGHPWVLKKAAVWQRCLIKLRFRLAINDSNWPLLTGGRCWRWLLSQVWLYMQQCQVGWNICVDTPLRHIHYGYLSIIDRKFEIINFVVIVFFLWQFKCLIDQSSCYCFPQRKAIISKIDKYNVCTLGIAYCDHFGPMTMWLQ